MFSVHPEGGAAFALDICSNHDWLTVKYQRDCVVAKVTEVTVKPLFPHVLPCSSSWSSTNVLIHRRVGQTRQASSFICGSLGGEGGEDEGAATQMFLCLVWTQETTHM